MKKLSLELDALRVESFATRDEPVRNPGTVRAHQDSALQTCGCQTYARTCTEYATCENTCNCPSWSGPECGTVCVG